ncbi:MAG: hypothetical protein K6F64_05460 [Clostridia bacterium]|nr:hypothetical protein [Clostridia bacterium]
MPSVSYAVRKALALLFSLISVIGNSFSGEPYVAEGNALLINSYTYSLEDGMCFGQGLACDGEYFYGFGAFKAFNFNAVTKIDADTGEILEINEMCLPAEVMLKGYSHLGDGCIYSGRLYVAMEDFGFRNPAVAVFDSGTLEFKDYFLVPAEGRGNGRIPWCAIKDGILYYTQSNDVDEIRMISLEDYSYAGAVKINKTLYKVQGGEFVGDKLYLVTNSEKYDKPVYEIDFNTGEVNLLFSHSTSKTDTEGEGIAICPLDSGADFHILDVGANVRISSFKSGLSE